MDGNNSSSYPSAPPSHNVPSVHGLLRGHNLIRVVAHASDLRTFASLLYFIAQSQKLRGASQAGILHLLPPHLLPRKDVVGSHELSSIRVRRTYSICCRAKESGVHRYILLCSMVEGRADGPTFSSARDGKLRGCREIRHMYFVLCLPWSTKVRTREPCTYPGTQSIDLAALPR